MSDLAAIRERHKKCECGPAFSDEDGAAHVRAHCHGHPMVKVSWPCDTAHVLEALEEVRKGLDSALCLLVEGVEFMGTVELRDQIQRVLMAALLARDHARSGCGGGCGDIIARKIEGAK